MKSKAHTHKTTASTLNAAPTVARAPKAKPQNIHAAMGALNAAHASANAFANAAPNSRVGLIAAYAEANVAGQVAAADLATAQAGLDALNASADTLRTDIAALEATIAAANQTIEAAALAGIDPTTDQGVIDAQQALADAQPALAAATAELAALETEIAAAEANVGGLQTAVETADAATAEALTAAANKEVTPEVKAELDRMLAEKGLLSVP